MVCWIALPLALRKTAARGGVNRNQQNLILVKTVVLLLKKW
jgi:hypothetical protein